MCLNGLIARFRRWLRWLMATFNVNPRRRAPYKGYKFRVKWDGRYVPGIDRVSGLRRTTEPVTHRGGGDSGAADTSPGQTTYDPIVLERGRTHDQAFERWANKVHNVGGGMGTEVSLGDYRQDVVIDLYNEAGQQAISYRVYGCWPSE